MTQPQEPTQSSLTAALALAGVLVWEWFPATQTMLAAGDFTSLGMDVLPATPEAWREYVHPDDRDLLDALLEEQQSEVSIRLHSAYGLWVWHAARAIPQPAAEGRPASLLITWRNINRDKQMEAALRDSQHRYRALYTTSPLAFVLWDRQGQITEWNRRAETIFGWSADAVIGQQIHRLLVPPNELGRFRETIDQLTKKKGDGSLSCWTLTASGERRFCSWHNITLYTPTGGLQGVLSLIDDNTDQHVSQEDLRKSEKAYRTLVETSPDAILLLGLDGTVQMANQQAHRLFGLDELSDISQTHLRAILPADPGDGAELLEALERPEDFTGIVLNRNLVLQHGDGHVFDAEVAFTTVFDDNGHPSGLVVFARDITEKVRAAAELQKHQTQLEALVHDRTLALEDARSTLAQILEGSPVPTFVLNADNVVTHWNRACEKVLDLAASEVIGTRDQWRAFYPTARPVLADLVMGGSMREMESLYEEKIHPSYLIEGAYEAESYFPKSRRWLFFTAAPLKNNEGKIIGAIETLQDVTERKLAEQYLLEAKQLAESAARSKAEFLANMSHEIRTPMNAVIGLAHLLLKTELSSKQREQVTRIHGAGKMLLGLINDILDFSKIEAGRMVLESTPFLLDEILDNVTSVVLGQAQAKGLELTYMVARDLPRQFVGDPLRISQILVNLIGNAIKFTDAGKITVEVALKSRAGEHAVLEFAIRDTGIGMSPEQQQRLFQAFSQADTSISRKFGGTGLGLTISKRLVELMRGKIWVESSPGQGSTFSFTLELSAYADPHTLRSSSGKRVLVVDDDALSGKVIGGLFEHLGWSASVVQSGREAVARLASGECYDCVTIDFLMPDLDGEMTAREIRALPVETPRLLLITAADLARDDLAGLHNQFDEVLNKPVTAAQIQRLLARLDGESGNGEPTEEPRLTGMRILLAEDIPTNQLIAREMLESFGAEVTVANHGGEVLEWLEKASFDAVLMDVQMPGMDGIEATRRIRSEPRWNTLPVLAMTAHAFHEERTRCLEAGMNDFLTKPIDPEALQLALKRWHRDPETPAPRQTTTQASPVTAVPDLPGIDRSEGLRRMMNKPQLYEKVLRDFYQRFRDESTTIRNELGAGEYESAQRRAHSLKGLAGSIGAARLAEASMRLQDSIRTNSPELEKHLGEFADALAQVTSSIATAFSL